MPANYPTILFNSNAVIPSLTSTVIAGSPTVNVPAEILFNGNAALPKLASFVTGAPIITNIIADSGSFSDNFDAAPMGALGEFALGDAQEDDEPTNIAGANSISVASTAGMNDYDQIYITLKNNSFFITTIEMVISSTVLEIADRLPEAATVGNQVIDFAAAEPTNLG